MFIFNLFKRNPVKKLQKEYEQLLEAAMLRQQNGDIAGFAELSDKAQKVLDEIDKLKAEAS